jgi:hypothetical protein
MSKLADKIRKALRFDAAPIGFVAAKAAPEATMVLCGIAKDAKDAADLAKRGADVVIVGSNGKAARPENATDAGASIAGAWIEGEADASQYKQAGFDFVAFDPDRTASTAVLEDGIGYVLALPHDAADNDLRALEGFQLDAIDIGKVEKTLTVRKQMDLRRISALTRKPLLAHVSGDISGPSLQALRDTNVMIVASEHGGDIEKLRKAIDALPPRTRRRDDGDRPSPLVPASAAVGGEEHDHDDD